MSDLPSPRRQDSIRQDLSNDSYSSPASPALTTTAPSKNNGQEAPSETKSEAKPASSAQPLALAQQPAGLTKFPPVPPEMKFVTPSPRTYCAGSDSNRYFSGSKFAGQEETKEVARATATLTSDFDPTRQIKLPMSIKRFGTYAEKGMPASYTKLNSLPPLTNVAAGTMPSSSSPVVNAGPTLTLPPTSSANHIVAESEGQAKTKMQGQVDVAGKCMSYACCRSETHMSCTWSKSTTLARNQE